jgi:hypothetical protein
MSNFNNKSNSYLLTAILLSLLFSATALARDILQLDTKQPIAKLDTINISPIRNFGVSANTPHYSSHGDTVYFGNTAIERSNGHENPSAVGALLGSAPQNTIANTTWGPEMRLTHTQDSIGGITQNPVGTVWRDTLIIAFSLHTNWSGCAPFLMKSCNGGDTWSQPWSITNPDTAQSATNRFINLYNGRLNTAGEVIWTDQFEYSNFYTKCSTNYGQSWSQPFFFFSIGQEFIGKYGGTAFKDTLITGFFHGEGHHARIVDSIKVAYSFNGGINWSGATNALYHENDNYLFWLRHSLGRVHLVFQDHSWNSGNTEIFYSQSDDWGVSWSDPVVVSDDSASIGQWPYLYATDDGRLIVSWYDYKYGSGGGGFTGDILYRLSGDNGDSWGPEMRLTYNQAATESRSFILGDHIGMVWEDHRTGFFSPELYFAESSDMGQTWGDEVRLTDAPGISDSPELLLSGMDLYLFWMDARDNPPFGNEIYFRKADVEVGIGGNNEELIPPGKVELSAYPSPFNSSTTIIYTIVDSGPLPIRINIDIYDIQGRKVRSLQDNREGAAERSIVWNGRGDSNHELTSGIYFARITQWGVECRPQKIKLILIK